MRVLDLFSGFHNSMNDFKVKRQFTGKKERGNESTGGL